MKQYNRDDGEMWLTKDKTLLGIVCIAMWCGLLIGGLWPFNFFPKNKVAWLRDRNGIHFDWYGQIYSTVPWDVSELHPDASQSKSFSIEIWLRPDKVLGWVSTIISIYDPVRPGNFRIEQSVGDLVVRGHFRDHNSRAGFKSLWLDDVLQKGRDCFVTITSGPQGTAIYLEAVRGKIYPYTLEADNFSGRLLAGHSAAGKNAWAGALLGLAIYDRALTPDEVSQHYKLWTQATTRQPATQKGIAGIYLFDERTGDRIRNHAGPMPDLVIPRRFYILQRRFLTHSLADETADLQDVALNILGFIPFGYLVSAYLYQAARLSRTRAVVLTIVLGILTSLLIELLQAYLPSRDSSRLDLINNIVGTTLGALVVLKLRLPDDDDLRRDAHSP